MAERLITALWKNSHETVIVITEAFFGASNVGERLFFEANTRSRTNCESWAQLGHKTERKLVGFWRFRDVSLVESRRLSVEGLGHNPKVGGSNPPPATKEIIHIGELETGFPFLMCAKCARIIGRP